MKIYENIIYENKNFYIQKEQSQIPWLIIWSKEQYKELHDMDKNLYLKLMNLSNKVAKIMSKFYKCDKINIASFGNYVPQVHMHIQARFKHDEYFPQSMWGKPERMKTDLKLKSFSKLVKKLDKKLG
jgi:diadenosine tetraphosphate (Ap4A) HIT family hydrolase